MTKRVARVDYSPVFEKQYRKAPLGIKKAFRNRLNVFISDKFHPLLHNHLLTGVHAGSRSINVTGNWRAVYKEISLDDEQIAVLFHLLGTHSQLYG